MVMDMDDDVMSEVISATLTDCRHRHNLEVTEQAFVYAKG